MINKNIYTHKTYKSFLMALEEENNRFSRGFRAKLAKTVGCNNAFISQVLNTHANFSLEQGLLISRYLNLTQDEESFFLLLIEHERAGTKELKQYFQKQILVLREKFLDIKDRVKSQFTLTAEMQATYYSHWYYAAMHMIVTIDQYRTVPSIAQALQLKPSVVKKVISFLLSTEMIIEKNEEFFSGPSYLHLDNNSPNIFKHHTNWRLAAINSLQNLDKGDVHYSTVSTMSAKDVEVLKEKLVQVVQDYVQVVSKSSSEEKMYSFGLDFFNLLDEKK